MAEWARCGVTDYDEKISRGLILWLREVKGIRATEAQLHESETEKAQFSGCETCGYGGDDDKIYTDIAYKDEDSNWGIVKLEGTSIDYLPTLLYFIDRAN